MPQPRANSSPVGGCFTCNGHSSPSNCLALGPSRKRSVLCVWKIIIVIRKVGIFYVPAGHIGSSLFGIVVTRWKSSWQGLQKCVVPKQKNTATEQQYRHLYSRKSAPCFGHICALATSLQPPHTSSAGSNDSPPNCASQRASPP